MVGINFLDTRRHLWKSYPTPFDIHVRKIVKERKCHPLYGEFLELYRMKRNHLVAISIEEVYHRRKSEKSRRSPRPKFAVANVLHDLKFLVFAMDEGLLTRDMCNLVRLTIPELTNRYEIQFINIAKTTGDLMARRHLYSSCKDSEMQNWFDYIRKIMGIYNVPREQVYPERIPSRMMRFPQTDVATCTIDTTVGNPSEILASARDLLNRLKG